ncbi:DNA mismatch repair endonuclease MutL [bacterium]|nr:DNA mismatch repair endonuclease MutL [bacterium]
MSKIHILPENVANKIAAGEIVERPASIVKELVENSIDAGATEIDLHIEAGGISKITVIDNGHGMTYEDVKLCLERHATSKITDETDLQTITSLGFRGEAIPSIASVSKMTIESKSASGDIGRAIHLEGGKITKDAECGCPNGTKIVVEDLFYNTPARKKFLKRDATEYGHCYDVISRLALSNNHIRFLLTSDGVRKLKITNENMDARIAQVLGKDVYDNLCNCDFSEGPIKLSGFISKPSFTKNNSNGLYIYVNGRFVKDRTIIHGVLEGYRNSLMRGQYPIAVLHLKMDPADVDVNVHPTKSEVRFKNTSAVHGFVSKAMRVILDQVNWLNVSKASEDAGSFANAQDDTQYNAGSFAMPRIIHNLRHSEGVERPKNPANDTGSFQPEADPPLAGAKIPLRMTQRQDDTMIQGQFSSLNVIGQLNQSYILCSNNDGELVIVDQHAAHERIGFEKLKRQFAENKISLQRMLIPATIELSPKESAIIEDHLKLLNEIGLEIEAFSENTYVVKAYPSILGNINPKKIVEGLLEDLESAGNTSKLDDFVDVVLKSMACHGQVRAGQMLSTYEMTNLLDEMDKWSNTSHCPHGRPSFVILSKSEIEKMFKRII